MIQTTPEKPVDLAVCGPADRPGAPGSGEGAASDGGFDLPLRGSGITSTLKVGDSAFEGAGSHEGDPGIALARGSTESKGGRTTRACIGHEAVRDESLDQVQLGDRVAIADIDSTRGPRWQPGATTRAVLVDRASRWSGHRVGV